MAKIMAATIGCLALALVVVLCVSSFAIAIMLHALNVFMQETPVAEVIMSPIQQDDNGEFMMIEFTPYLQKDGLAAIVDPSNPGTTNRGSTETYKIYGDTVAIRGPFLKLHDGLLLLNYQNVYKLSLIEGEYRRNNNPNRREGTEIFINGGFDNSWWLTNQNEAFFPYNLVIDRFTFSGDEEPGFFGDQKKRYEIVVTRDTITWNAIG